MQAGTLKNCPDCREIVCECPRIIGKLTKKHMTQFKVNDKVTVKAGCKHECSVLENEVFDYLIIDKVHNNNYYAYTAYHGGEKINNYYNYYTDDHLELYIAPAITWDTLKWKDVVVDRDGDEQMVLGLLNDMLFLSDYNDFKSYDDWYHKQELQNEGYTIKQATPVDKLELTLEQVAEKFGVEVTNIKIKK